MLISKKNRHAIYEMLFKEGVMVAKKDYNEPKHPDFENIPNLEVIKAMQSLKSRNYVQAQFAWRHFYWYLTNEGTQYLREYLHLPAEIVPATLKRPAKSETARPRPTAVRADSSRAEEDRSTYRRPTAPLSDKKAEVGAGSSDLVFKGGYGRGRGPPPS